MAADEDPYPEDTTIRVPPAVAAGLNAIIANTAARVQAALADMTKVAASVRQPVDEPRRRRERTQEARR